MATAESAPSLLPSWIHRDLLRHQKGFWWRWHPRGPPPNPTPTNFCLPPALYFKGLAAEEGVRGGRDISPGRYISKARLGGGEGRKEEWKIRFKKSLPFLQCPKAREKKEQPAPTSKPGGGDAKQCGTPWHPSAAASEAAAAIAVINSSRWDGASREEGRPRGPGQKTH